MSISLIKHQIAPANNLKEFLLDIGEYGKYNNPGCLVIGNTGVGKTFVLADAIFNAQQNGKFLSSEDKPFKNYCVMMMTPKRAITQQKRVFYKAGIKDFEIINHNSLATKSYGSLFIEWVTEYKHGELDKQPVWIEESKPDVLIVDECQLVKNPRAARTKIVRAAIRQGIKVILVSATPFAKASEAEQVVLACGIVKHEDNVWEYIKSVSFDPEKYSPLAIKRIKADLKGRNALINITGARYPYKPIVNNIKLSLTPAQRAIYDESWNEYLKVLEKEGRRGPSGIMAIWVAQNKHRECTDKLKAPAMAARAFQVANLDVSPRQVIIASNFVGALEMVWNCLVKTHGVSPDKISVLFGGVTDKQGQKAIDDFQEGKTDYFLTTMKSGGTSISLHHENESAKPRYVLLPPTWSIYEMVQVLGRAQRITSLSQTIQDIVWFRDTIEEKVADTVGEKWKSMREMLEKRDNFIQDMFHSEARGYITTKIESPDDESDDDDSNESGIDSGILPGEEKEFGDTE